MKKCGVEPLGRVISDAFEQINLMADLRDPITGVPTGFHDFDRLTCGLRATDLIVLAARPSMGKTAMAINISLTAALEYNVPVCFFSLEMARDQLGHRFLCSISQVNSNSLRTGNISDSDWPKITRAARLLSKAPIFLDDTPNLSGTELWKRALELKVERDIGLIVVDYLQLMTESGKGRQKSSETTSRALKDMAIELNIPVIVLSQLKRDLEYRPNKRPILSDLPQKSIEQDADMICFFYRDEVYNRSMDNPQKGMAELIIQKCKRGGTGTVKLTCSGSHLTFANLPFSDDV